MHEKPTNTHNYSFSLLITYGISYMFRHYIVGVVSSGVVVGARHETQHTHPQYSIDCSSIENLSDGTKTLPEDGNVMPKHVEATIHN
jgi:hypothetical protein